MMKSIVSRRLPLAVVGTIIVLCTVVITPAFVGRAAEKPTKPENVAKPDEPSAKSLVGREVTNFILPDAAGKQVALSDYGEKRAVALFFMGTYCPISNLYLTELSKLQKAYGKQGLQVIGINSNAGVTQEELRKHAEEFKTAMPVLLDSEQRLADRLGALRTAEVFLLDARRIVRYHGRVDDRFGYTYKNDKPRRRDLELALKEVLAEKPVSVAQTKPLGCLITHSRREKVATDVTYAKDISRILERRCQECHRPGMIGPFSLSTYDDAVNWTAMMKEVVLQKRMPPWHADPRYGHWSNNRQMPQVEVDTLITWIDSGAPFGDKNDLPAPKQYAEGWMIDEPDLVFQIPEEITVNADGVVPYLYFTVPTNFKEDVWIQAAEARPGNRAVVHHIIVFCKVRDDEGRLVRQQGHICGMAPGDPPLVLPPGIAKRIPAGSELLFQLHYTPTGKVERDRSEVGLVLYKGKEPPIALAETKGIMNTEFEIPAGAANHPVKSSHTFGRDVKLLTLMPHMHLRGKDFRYQATYPDGTSEVLLSVPRYDFNWQNTYRFAKPFPLPKGSRLDCVAHFDNAESNPANPDATEAVRWGDQTWEEMMIGWVGYIADRPAKTPAKNGAAKKPQAERQK